ncbi:DUF1801 domain-containing protein [Oceanobacillus chungangensis]|uniref:YdhG-like domain-containing protein n=1 Tax=Oceanobacillus chungangensis TaxID=1229152 RepID=A0A3D8PTB9_9BACI|nr:DUF1801 domain-containing protein [Oceanobacillus chungangensis]RDW19400.1 hypothetical protein CWR45_08185 [Oceanobacillus chungangensis]
MVSNKSDKVDQLIEALPENIEEITTCLRNLIFAASENFKEEVKWGMPSYSENGNVCYLQPSKKHVNLGFYLGASLKDEEALLEGTGKQMRHIRITKLEEIQTEKFKVLIRDAIAKNA